MFSRSLDRKNTYDYDGVEVVDLTESIFDRNYAMTQICTLYKVSKELEMRPDLVSKSLYGTTDYAEMILKYSMINNPFSIEMGDLIYSASLSSIYNPVKQTDADTTGIFDAVKNYHKYIDKSKVPDKAGSDSVTTQVKSDNKTPQEANISKKGNSGLTVKNGKIYFGAIDESLIATDSSIVDCATDGTSLGEFLNATLRNSNSNQTKNKTIDTIIQQSDEQTTSKISSTITSK
jgi:hypothetical protein